MSKILDKAKKLLVDEDLKFVLINNNEIIKSKDRGVKPLLNMIRNGAKIKNFSAADMVVGKAAALLYLHLGVKEIYARLISEEAVKLFEDHNIYYEYTLIQPYIKNRDLTDICPMDKSVRNISEPKDAFFAISEAVNNLMKSQNM